LGGVDRRANQTHDRERVAVQIEAMSLWSTARRAAEESGRDPDAVKKIIRVNGVHGESVAHLADRLARFAEQGADEAVVDFVFTYPTIDERLDAADRLMRMATW
jgi:hypothetical protein